MITAHLKNEIIFGIIAVTLLGAVGTVSTVFASNLYVGPGGGSGLCATPTYSTIQSAITAASSGDTVHVCPGTYSEQLTIDKSLTLKGSGADVTTILDPGTLVADGFGALNIIETTGPTTTVDFSDFTVSGPGSINCNSLTSGIFVSGGATLDISQSTITAIHDTPAGGCQNGVGIFVGRNAYGTTGHADIQDVTITKYQKGGIVVDNAGSTAKIKDNTINWDLSPLNIASNGIQISRGADATVSDNKVTGNICTLPGICYSDLLSGTQADGILLYQSGGETVVHGNDISNNDIGIAVQASPSSVKVNGNKVTQQNNDAGIIVQDGTNTISDNVITGPGNVGIGIIADSANTFVTLEDNKIKDAVTQIQSVTSPTSPATTPPTSYTANITFVHNGNGNDKDNNSH